MTPARRGVMRETGRRRAGLRESLGQGQAGQVGAAATGLIRNAVQVPADHADADIELGGDPAERGARSLNGDGLCRASLRSPPVSAAVQVQHLKAAAIQNRGLERAGDVGRQHVVETLSFFGTGAYLGSSRNVAPGDR
jgi:hypothetical protein